MNGESIIFIYNAGSSPIAQAIDFFHKMLSPATYPCNLCKITYDRFNIDPKWKKFTDDLPIKVRFLHKDEFEKKYPGFKTGYPVALHEKDGTLSGFISVEEMNGCKDREELISVVKEKLGQ